MQRNQKDLSKVFEEILGEIIGIDVDIDIKRDAIAIENLREYAEKENSLFVSNPELSKEWDYERNCGLKPEDFTANSGKKAWWKCKNGHSWQTQLRS